MKSEPILEATQSFDSFWREIQINIDYIKTYGSYCYPGYEDKWDESLEAKFKAVQPFLTSVSKLQLFDDPENEEGRFSANNYHEALMFILNPPERWFGKIWVFNSEKYLKSIAGAKAEEDEVLRGVKQDNVITIALPKKKIRKSTQYKSKQSTRSPRSKPKKGELLSDDATMLLSYLMIHHKCYSECPNSTPFDSGEKVADKLREKNNGWNQSRVSRALQELMNQITGAGLQLTSGKKKYKCLCHQNRICEKLIQLDRKSLGDNNYFKTFDGDLDQLSDRGY